MSRGWVINEIVRRADPKGRTVAEILDEDISDKLGCDLHVGCP